MCNCDYEPCRRIPPQNYCAITASCFIGITAFVVGILFCEGIVMEGTESFFIGAGILSASFIAFCCATCKACCSSKKGNSTYEMIPVTSGQVSDDEA